MSSSNSLAMIEKLTGRENYSTWRFAIKTYLQHEELWDCVEPMPGVTVDLKRDIKAKSKIILLVDSVNYVHIQEATTAKEVWDCLANAFDDSGLTRRVGLLRDLCTTNLAGCSNVEDYVSKIMTTAHKLRNIGFKVDDEWLGTLLLSGLPETYKPMIMAIESSGMKICADSVKSKILQDVKISESDTSAFATNHNKGNTGSKKQFKRGPRCYNCNKYGHVAAECKSKPKKKNQESSSYAAAFIASTMNPDEDPWYIDSGASVHMTKHKNLLQDENVPLIKTIKVANDKSLSVHSTGQLSLDVCNDKVRPDEEFPEPTLRIMAKSTVYELNATKAIFCKGQNLVEPIQWYSPSGKLVEERSTKNSRVFVERKTEDNGVLVPLIIHKIKISDGGNWTCKAGNLSETKEFIVGEKVKIADSNVTIEGEEGKSVKLTCEANGYPPPVVVWYKDKRQIRDKDEPKKYSIKADNTLEIKKLNHADVGLYVCKVRQKALSHYTEKTVHLSVQHKPILYNSDTQMIYTNQKYKTEEVYAILNDTKNVTCSAIANPPPTYRWFRRVNGFDDDPITDPDTVITSEDGTNSVLILRIRDESYYGEYRCSASNTKGSESIIFHVNPGSKPEPPDFVSLVVANATELTFNVTCSSCIFATGDEVSPNPENLTVIGYIFQLAPAKEGYPADWDGAPEFRVDIEEANNTLFTVGPLTNSTLYHVRVRTRNAAGNSEWMESADAKTTDDAIRLTAALVLVIATVFVHLFY